MLGPPIGKVTSGEPLDEDEVRETVKKIDRVHEKTLSDYEGDHRRVVDLVRASCIFETAAGLTSAIEFLKSSALLRVVRTKDRFNNPRDGCVQAGEGGGRAACVCFARERRLAIAGTVICLST